MHRPVALLVVLVVLLSACGGAGASPGASASGPPASAPGGEIASPEEAAAAVFATEPRFEGLGPFDPELIGQCCWYEVTEDDAGYIVKIHVGWGDCPAGCINRHEWTYAVARSGEVGLIGDTGDPLPAGEFPPG